MSMDFLTNYINVVVLGICLCVGYIVKNAIPGEGVNKFIPLISGALGVALSVWAAWGISPDVVLSGLFSGLAATGLYEAFRNLIGSK